MSVPLCPACGQPLPPPRDDCATPGCGHPLNEHNITSGRQRSECSRFGPQGRCPCQRYAPAEAGP